MHLIILGKNIHNGLLLTNIQQIFMTTKRRTKNFPWLTNGYLPLKNQWLESFRKGNLYPFGSSKKTKKIYSRLDAHNMPIPIRANNASHDPLAFLLSTWLWLETYVSFTLHTDLSLKYNIFHCIDYNIYIYNYHIIQFVVFYIFLYFQRCIGVLEASAYPTVYHTIVLFHYLYHLGLKITVKLVSKTRIFCDCFLTSLLQTCYIYHVCAVIIINRSKIGHILQKLNELFIPHL
ncbi:hypothetical protein ACJX0J_025834 [Zea mays]